MWIYGLEVVDGLVAEIFQSAGSTDWFEIIEVNVLLISLTILRLVFLGWLDLF